jgi:hypothetical protein
MDGGVHIERSGCVPCQPGELPERRSIRRDPEAASGTLRLDPECIENVFGEHTLEVCSPGRVPALQHGGKLLIVLGEPATVRLQPANPLPRLTVHEAQWVTGGA